MALRQFGGVLGVDSLKAFLIRTSSSQVVISSSCQVGLGGPSLATKYSWNSYISNRPVCQFRNMQTSPETKETKKRSNWQPETEKIYLDLKTTATKNGWLPVPRPSRPVFTRVQTEDGPVIHYALFVDEKDVKLHGVCEFTEQAQGPRGLAHGGASALMHDSVTGVLTERGVRQRSVTASLNVNYRRPTPVNSPVVVEAFLDKIEGNKIYLKSFLKSADGATTYSDSTVLYINIESKLQGMTNI